MAGKQNGGKTPPPKAKEQPAHKIRIGRISVAIWRNSGQQGDWFSMTFSRSYKDGETWKSADSFGRDDLLPLAEVSRMAFHWIHRELQRQPGDDQQDEPLPI